MSILQSVKKMLRKRGDWCTAILVAAGSSERMGGQDKLLADLGGMTVLERSALALEESDRIREIVVVTRQENMERVSQLLHDRGLTKVTLVVPGGKTRAESVQAGLENVSDKTVLVAIHDAARPLVSQRIINETVAMALKTRASAPAIPVKDTVKVAKSGVVTDTPDRSTLFAVQTPQVFDCDLLRAAHKKAAKKNIPLTDDCMAAEQLGLKVFLTQGDETNLKITTPLDLSVAKLILEGQV